MNDCALVQRFHGSLQIQRILPFSDVGIVYRNTVHIPPPILPYLNAICSAWPANHIDSFKKMSFIFTLGRVLILLPVIESLHHKN
jgi:hypothetical protein